MTSPAVGRPDRTLDPPHYQHPGITLPRWLYGHATCHQLVVLGALIHHLPDARPSHTRIAGLAGISVASVKRTIAELVDRGWLVIEHRYGTDGARLPSRYLIHLDPVDPLPPSSRPHSSQGAIPQLTVSYPPSSQGAIKRETSNTLIEEQEQEEIEPPLPPTGGQAVGASPIQPSLLPSDHPVANTGSKAVKKPSRWPIPPEFAEFSELLDDWIELQVVVNPDRKLVNPWGPRQKSAGALRLAISKGVAIPFLEDAAEKGWKSLGHPGHKEQIDRLAAPPSALSAHSRSRFQSHNPEPRDLQPLHISPKPGPEPQWLIDRRAQHSDRRAQPSNPNQ